MGHLYNENMERQALFPNLWMSFNLVWMIFEIVSEAIKVGFGSCYT